jgi:hypothetical protein
LLKNPDLTVLTVDPRKEPYAVQQGIIASVDISETLTPLTLDMFWSKPSRTWCC